MEKTQHKTIQQIWKAAKVLENLTSPPLLEVEPHDIPLRDAANSYARRLEMQGDAWDPAYEPVGNDLAQQWARVEHAARRLAETLSDIEQTDENRAALHAARALAEHCHLDARTWKALPMGEPEPR